MMEMFTQYSFETSLIYLFLGGVFAGIINVFSAGGSFISLPLLEIAGLSLIHANATNRLALLLQNIISVSIFYKKKKLKVQEGFWLAIPSLMGAIIGAFIAVYLNEKILKIIVLIAFCLMLCSLFFKPDRWLHSLIKKKEKKLNGKEFCVFFLVGLYGGLIQAGVGIFLLGACVWASGYALKQANPIKSFIILTYTSIVLCIFSINGIVHWPYGLALGSGSILGAWIGTHLVIKAKPSTIRWALIIVCFIFILHFFKL